MGNYKFGNIISLLKKVFYNSFWVIAILIVLKILFQLFIYQSGYRWLSADDYCRTVKSFEWLQKPEINSGVWLSPHFWVNGLFMVFIKDIIFAAALVNIFFSTLTLIFFYKLTEVCFDRKTAVISSLIFIFFPFQVWLSMSGLPESIFIFFVISGLYYLILWEKNELKISFLLISSILIGLSNVFRYEGWVFSVVLVFLVIYRVIRNKTFDKKAIIYIPGVITLGLFKIYKM